MWAVPDDGVVSTNSVEGVPGVVAISVVVQVFSVVSQRDMP